MVSYIIKYQLRTALFAPFSAIIFIMFLCKFTIRVDYTIFIIFFFQSFFVSTFKLMPYSGILFKITGMKLSSHFIQANISMLVWINLFFAAGYFLLSALFQPDASELIDELLKINILTFSGFITGNKISVSDLHTVKNKTVRFLSITMLFSILMSFVYGVLILITYFCSSQIITGILLVIIFLIWNFSITGCKHFYINQYIYIK